MNSAASAQTSSRSHRPTAPVCSAFTRSETTCRTNLIKVVNDWLNPPKPTTASKTQEGRPGKDNATEPERVIQGVAALVREREKAISELESELANRDDAIADLRRLLTEYEQDIVSLRDPLSDEARDRALFALTSSRKSEFAAIAKRYHWRLNDLRREVQN